MKIKKGFLLREVADNYIVVAVGSAVKDFNGIITLNDTAAFLWRQLQDDATEEQLLEKMLAEYDVSKEQAEADVKMFVEKLQQANLVD